MAGVLARGRRHLGQCQRGGVAGLAIGVLSQDNRQPRHGLDGLRPRKAPGRRPKVPALLGEEIRRWVIQGPAKQGLDRANWTHAELADHLLKTHGIAVSRTAMQRSCR